MERQCWGKSLAKSEARGAGSEEWGKVLLQIMISLLLAREKEEAEKQEQLERGEEGSCFK